MNGRQKEILQAQLNNEKQVLKELQQVFKQAIKDCSVNISQLSTRTDMENIQAIIYQQQYQNAIRALLETALAQLQSGEYATISDYLTRCYQNGYVGAIYDIAGQGIPLIVPIDQNAVLKALQIDSKLSKSLYDRLGEDVKKLKTSIRAEVSRGVSNGSSWNEIGEKISLGMNSTIDMFGFNKAKNNSIRIARTEGHRIQNQSAMDAQEAAKKKGADVLKQWCAALDGNTRPAHAQADGQIKELDEYFIVGGEKMKAPGIGGSAANVCNCRCALLQRARWALDGKELDTLKERAEYFGLDKSKDFEEYKAKYLEISKEDIEKLKKEVHNISKGKNLVGEYQPTGNYDFAIEEIINKQGYDGTPQVVPYKQFKEAMNKSNFYAERTYSANTQEKLDEYREMLYNGKFYVDCSTGGAQYGQGMYCAACYDLNNKSSLGGIGWEMSHYQQIGISAGRNYSYTEGLTLQPGVKVLELPKGKKAEEYIAELYKYDYLKKYASAEQSEQVEKYIKASKAVENLTYEEDSSVIDDLYNKRAEATQGIEELIKLAFKAMEDTSDGKKYHGFKNPAVLASEMGYDAINAIGHGESGSYTVILNRTKVIFCEGGSIYGN